MHLTKLVCRWFLIEYKSGMLHDSILRCLVPVKFEGQTTEQIFDAVKDGDNYLIVLEWGTPDENQRGISPKQCVVLPSSEIEAVSDLNAEYELVSQTGIDFDTASFSDVEAVTNRLFQPPPR